MMFCGFAGALVAFIIVPAVDRASGSATSSGTSDDRGRDRRGAAASPRPELASGSSPPTSPPRRSCSSSCSSSSRRSNVLLGDRDPAAVAGASTATTPVVMLVFDEFALGTWSNAQGHLDAARFPGFARLAKLSTWYPNMHDGLDGHRPRGAGDPDRARPGPNAAPVASVYPRSLFTMLGRSGPVHAIEDVTHICPNSICSDRRTPSPSGLLSDTAIVFGHNVLPSGLESSWLPSIDGQWSEFGDDNDAVPPSTANQPTIGDYKAAVPPQARSAGRAGRSGRRCSTSTSRRSMARRGPGSGTGTSTSRTRGYKRCPTARCTSTRRCCPTSARPGRASRASPGSR